MLKKIFTRFRRVNVRISKTIDKNANQSPRLYVFLHCFILFIAVLLIITTFFNRSYEFGVKSQTSEESIQIYNESKYKRTKSGQNAIKLIKRQNHDSHNLAFYFDNTALKIALYVLILFILDFYLLSKKETHLTGKGFKSLSTVIKSNTIYESILKISNFISCIVLIFSGFAIAFRIIFSHYNVYLIYPENEGSYSLFFSLALILVLLTVFSAMNKVSNTK